MVDQTTIYMPLLDEGTDVWVPVLAERLGESQYRVLGPMPDDQEWLFPPESIVRLASRSFATGHAGLGRQRRSV